MADEEGPDRFFAHDYDEMVEFDERDDHLGHHDRLSQGDESDNEELMPRMTDTTAAEARLGKDIQGIPWERLQFTRDKYRETRLQQYKNYENLNPSHEEIEKNCKYVDRRGNFYNFQYNTRSVKSTIVHFQLRNLVWATSKHDVYMMYLHSVMHWSALTRRGTKVLNLSGPLQAGEACPLAYHSGLGRVQISTMCVKRNLLVAGGFQGELVCKNLDSPGVLYRAKITHDDNPITNAIEIYDNASGVMRLMTSNNDSVVRVFDCESFAVLGRFHFPWAVNHTSISPDSKTIIVVGDNTDGLLADAQNGKVCSDFGSDLERCINIQVIATLKGHLDFSFASAWHPDGHIFATGNQDTTCRLWDVRNLSSAVAVLKGRIGAVRSIRFTSDGSFMAMAEPADFVHVYDTKHGYNQCQEIDLFGEVAGISFSADTEALYIGVSDRTYGSLLEFNRIHTSYDADYY